MDKGNLITHNIRINSLLFVCAMQGLKGKPDAFPHRKSQVYLFDFNKPHFGAVPVTFKDYTTEGFNPHGITAWRDNKGRGREYSLWCDVTAVARVTWQL